MLSGLCSVENDDLPVVFWDAHGIIYINYLEKGKYINSDYYIELLVRLKDEIAKKTTAHEEKNHLSSNCLN